MFANDIDIEKFVFNQEQERKLLNSPSCRRRSGYFVTPIIYFIEPQQRRVGNGWDDVTRYPHSQFRQGRIIDEAKQFHYTAERGEKVFGYMFGEST